jgi:hypothetical protein
MFILVCQKCVCLSVCLSVCVYVYGHFCGLISQWIWMKLGTKLDDDVEKAQKLGFSGSLTFMFLLQSHYLIIRHFSMYDAS